MYPGPPDAHALHAVTTAGAADLGHADSRDTTDRKVTWQACRSASIVRDDDDDEDKGEVEVTPGERWRAPGGRARKRRSASSRIPPYPDGAVPPRREPCASALIHRSQERTTSGTNHRKYSDSRLVAGSRRRRDPRPVAAAAVEVVTINPFDTKVG